MIHSPARPNVQKSQVKYVQGQTENNGYYQHTHNAYEDLNSCQRENNHTSSVGHGLNQNQTAQVWHQQKIREKLSTQADDEYLSLSNHDTAQMHHNTRGLEGSR